MRRVLCSRAFVLCLALFASGLAGCGDDTTSNGQVTLAVDITAAPLQGVAPLDVAFTSAVTGGAEVVYGWDFGDGGTATEANPTHTFAAAGTYSVTLTVTEGDAATASDTVEITVLSALTVAVDADPTAGMAPLLVSFGAAVEGGVPPYDYAWNFGDGGAARQSSASHLYVLAGAFEVELTVTDALGNTTTDTVTVDVTGDNAPVAAISANPTLGVAPLDVVFLGNAIGGDEPLTFAWTFGDGSTDDTQNPTHTFADPGTYSVVLMVTDADGDQSSDTLDVAVGSNAEPAVEISAVPTSGIEPLDVAFVAHVAGGNPPLSYAWDLDGDGNADAHVPAVSFNYAAGSHTVSVIVTDADGDTATDTVTITVDADTTPEVTVTATPEAGQAPLAVAFTCAATGVNLPWTVQWDFGNGEVSSLADPTHTYTAPGRYTATCRVIDADGDMDEASVAIDVQANATPQVAIQADPVVGIAALDVDFLATIIGGDAPLTFAWNFGDGGTDTVQNPTHTFASAGTFTVVLVVTDADGDQTTGSIDISVTTDDLPVVELTATPTDGVEPLNVSLVANVAGGNAPVTIAWDFDGDGTTDSAQATTAHVFAAGSHTVAVTVTDGNGDTDTDTVTITVAADTAPTVTATATPASGYAPLGVAFDCAATGGNAPLTYRWELGNGQSSTLEDPFYTYTQVGTFTATCTVTDANGDVASARVPVTVDADLIPAVFATANPRSGTVPLTVDLAATATGGNGALTYAWDLGDGSPVVTTASVTHTYATFGSYTATVTVTDADGDTASSSVTIDVINAPPVAVATASTDCAVPWQTTVVFDASGSSDPELAALTYEWTFVSLPAGSAARLNSTTVVAPSFVPDVNGTYTARVFVFDGTHRVASATVSVVASGTTASLVVTAGNNQTAQVATAFTAQPQVEAANACGATIANKSVRWSGTGVQPQPASTYTDDDGLAAVALFAGTRAGAASLEASSDGAVVTFDFTVTPGPPATLTMAPVPPTEAAVTDLVLTFDIADQYGNPTTGTDVTFDVQLWGAGELSPTPGACGSGMAFAFGLTTSGGTANVYLCTTVAGELPIFFRVTSDPAIQAMGYDVRLDDLEGGAGSFDNLGAWELGTPTSGPGAAFSGSNVLATGLDGNYLGPNFWYEARYRLSNSPFEVLSSSVTIQHWYDVGSGDGDCWDASAWVEGRNPWWGSFRMVPVGGYPVDCAPWAPSFSGQSGGWIETTFETPEGYPPASNVSFRMNSRNWGAFTAHPGWYIDDLRVTLLLRDGGVVRILPGPPTDLVASTEAQGSACAPGRARVVVQDAFGNRVGGTTLDLAVDNGAEVASLLQGSNFGGRGPTTSADTDANGFVVVVIDTMGTLANVTLTAAVAATPSIDATTLVASTVPDESGWCNDGVDNDCNGAMDCNDLACAPTPACIGESCARPLDLGMISRWGWGYSNTFCNRAADEPNGCWPEPMDDAFHSFTVETSGQYNVCSWSNGPAEAWWSLGEDWSCPNGWNSCGWWQPGDCTTQYFSVGQTYFISVFTFDDMNACFNYGWDFQFQCVGDGAPYGDESECCAFNGLPGSGDPDGDFVCGSGGCIPDGMGYPGDESLCCAFNGLPGSGDPDGDGVCGGGGCIPDGMGYPGDESLCCAFNGFPGSGDPDGDGVCGGGGCIPDGNGYPVDESQCCAFNGLPGSGDPDGDGVCGGAPACTDPGNPCAGGDLGECCSPAPDAPSFCKDSSMGTVCCLPDGTPYPAAGDPTMCCGGDPELNGRCGADACAGPGVLCGSDADCCSGGCFTLPAEQRCCLEDGLSWTLIGLPDSQLCCSGDGDGDGTCGGPACTPSGSSCLDNAECCSGSCFVPGPGFPGSCL